MISKRTIIYVGGFELPDKNAAAQRVLANAKLFRENGFDVVFIDVDKQLKNNVHQEKECAGFKCFSQSYPRNTFEWLHFLRDINYVKKIIELVDNVTMIVCYNLPSIALFRLMLYCRKKRFKVVADCTEWYGIQGESLLKKLVKGFDSFLRMRIFHKKLDGIIVISHFLLDYYKKMKVLYLPPLVDLSESKWQHCIEPKNDKTIHLVYAGSPGRTKENLSSILKALFLLRNECDFKFFIIGITLHNHLAKYPEDNTFLSSLDRKVYFLGHLPHNQVIPYLCRADFSLFFREDNIVTKAGFPTKLVESISCGVPVITNYTSDIGLFIENGVNGFLLENGINLEEQMKMIFLKPVSSIKSLKNNVKRNSFDFRNYLFQMNEFLKSLGYE